MKSKTKTPKAPIKQTPKITVDELLTRAIVLIRKRSRLIIRDEALLREYLTSKIGTPSEEGMSSYEQLCVEALEDAASEDYDDC